MGGISEIEWRERLYRQLARQSGLPAGLRPVLIKRAELCVDRSFERRAPSFTTPQSAVKGCKGAIGC